MRVRIVCESRGPVCCELWVLDWRVGLRIEDDTNGSKDTKAEGYVYDLWMHHVVP
jgi:hypothetical protein